MARQTFTKGQTVYVARYSRHNWRKAVVAKPNVVQTSSGFAGRQRDIHYIGINYVLPDGTVDTERTWNILNNRQQIVTEEAHAEVERGQNIGKLRQTIDAYRIFETNFAEYVEQARIIVETVGGDVDKLALYLRGTFSLRSSYSCLTRSDVTEVRTDKREAAHAAHLTLQGMGETPPELP